MGVSKSLQKYALDTDLLLKADLESATGYVRPSQLPPVTPQQQNGGYVVNGGKVAYLNTAYDFRVSPCQYVVGGARYSTIQTDVSLSASHATFNRFDIIGVNTGQQVVVIQGTPAANPSTPDFDALSGLALSTILVVANSTTPYGNTSIYLENTEWTTAVNGNIVANSASNPFAGSTDIEATAAAHGAYIRLTNASLLSLAPMKQLTFMMRSKATWPSQKSLRITWYSGSTKVGQTVQVSNGRYGFVDSQTTSYQLIVIPITDFAVPNTVTIDRLEIFVNGNGSTIGFYIDNILLEPNSTAVDTVTTLSASQLTGPYTTAGMTMAQYKVLARTTTGTGPAEEIGVSDFFSLQSGTLSFGGVLPGIITTSGSNVTVANALNDFVIDVTKGLNTKTVSANQTFTLSATPATPNTWFSLFVTNTDPNSHTLTVPTGFSIAQATEITSVLVPGNAKIHLTYRYDGTGYTVYGDTIPASQLATGRQTIYIPSSAMVPSVTSGCSTLRSVEIATMRPNINTIDFNGTSGNSAQFSIAMPKSWDEGTLQAEFLWSHLHSGSTLGVVWGLQAVAVSSDDSIDAAFGTAQTVLSSGTVPNKLYRSSGTPAITVGGSPTTGDLVFFRLFRDPDAAADNFTGDARLHGIKLYYIINTANDN